MIEPYKFHKHSVRESSRHENELLLEAFAEVLRALEIISIQLDQIIQEKSAKSNAAGSQ